MKHLLLVLMLSLPLVLVAQEPSVPKIPFESVPNFLKIPVNMYLGEVSGVAVNSKGHVFVLSRGNTTGPAMQPLRRSCSNSTPQENSFARSAITSTPGRSRIP